MVDYHELTAVERSQADRHALRRQLKMLRRRFLIILLCVVVATGAAIAYSLTQPNKYMGKSVLLFRNPGFDQTILGAPSFNPTVDPTREAATNVKLVSLSVVAART